MKKFGKWTEQENSQFRTSSDNKVLTIAPPTTLTGASLTLTLPDNSGTTDTLLSRTSVDSGTNRLQNKELSSTNVKFVDNSDTSKKVKWDLSTISTATERTILIPDSSDTMALLTQVQTLTNKTIDGDNNTIQDLALSTLKTTGNLSVFLQRDGSGNVIDSTKSVPTGDVIGSSDTQTLTGKTIDADNNTITNIENADIKAAAGIVFSKMVALTINRALTTDGSGEIIVSSVTDTELGYVSGVTSGIQSQINSKQADVITTEGDVIVGDNSGDAVRLAIGGVGTVLTSNGTVASWSSPAGTGDVTSAANITDNALVRGDGGAKGIQDTSILIDDSDNITGINYAQANDGFLTKQENTNTFTIPTGYSMVHSNMTVKTGTTITVDSGANLDVFDVITVDGTLTVNGTCTLR